MVHWLVIGGILSVIPTNLPERLLLHYVTLEGVYNLPCAVRNVSRNYMNKHSTSFSLFLWKWVIL